MLWLQFIVDVIRAGETTDLSALRLEERDDDCGKVSFLNSIDDTRQCLSLTHSYFLLVASWLLSFLASSAKA